MNPLLQQAINELSNLNSGEMFLVKELFKGYEWNRLDRSVRLNLGTIFLNHIQNNSNLSISILGKTSSNQQKYQKN